MSKVRNFIPALAGVLLTSPQLLAAEDGGASIIDGIKNAGAIGAFIILMSVVAMALIIEHFVTIKREKLAPPEVIDEIEELFNDKNYQEALEACEAEPCYFTNVVLDGIRKIGHPFPTIEKHLEEKNEEENLKLQQKIGWLSLIAGLGPMMGLFGTVWGMVGAFAKISSAGAGGVNPADFAGTISLALMTTVLGLVVAIPTTAFFAFFRNKVQMLSLEIGTIVEDLFERFRPEAKELSK
jgi:biopolymer transport protein ExbB